MCDTERLKRHKVWDMSQKRIVTRIFGQKGEVVTGGWKELCNESSTILYPETY
jgi:hypothetical protein